MQHRVNERSLLSHTGPFSLFFSFSISPSSPVVERAWQKTVATYVKGLPFKVSITTEMDMKQKRFYVAFIFFMSS